MTWYERLGVSRVINVAGRYTQLGGSVMPPEVVEAIVEAAADHVDINLLQRRVGDRIASLTHNEAAYVTCGAAAGLVLAILAARTGTDDISIRRVAEGRDGPSEVICQRAHQVPYVPAITLSGASVVEVGNLMRTEPVDVRAAVTERTKAIVHIAGSHLPRGSLGLDDVVTVAREAGIPVIVDAAAQLPPADNLWRFTRDQGADLAVFSGGKDLCGPQASGLIVGSAELIEAIRKHGSPNQRLARAFKTGKEELVGLVAAIERYVRDDGDARRRRWDTVLADWADELAGIDGLDVVRESTNEAGQPIPRLRVQWSADSGLPPTEVVVQRLLSGDPSVAVARVNATSFALTPETVTDDDARLVIGAVREAMIAAH